jgi:hypothetical protein
VRFVCGIRIWLGLLGCPSLHTQIGVSRLLGDFIEKTSGA